MNYAAAIVDDSSVFRSGLHWETTESPVPAIIRTKSTAVARAPDYRVTVQKEYKKFRKAMEFLIKRWTIEVEDMSSFSDMISHGDYKTISAKGSRAIPILLNELRHRPHFWFNALQILVKANYGIDIDPVKAEDRGNLFKMSEAWIAWGEEVDLI